MQLFVSFDWWKYTMCFSSRNTYLTRSGSHDQRKTCLHDKTEQDLGDWERWTWAFWSWPNSHTHTHTLLQHHILGEHFGTRRRHNDHSASTEFDLHLFFPPSNTLIVHVYSFPRRTISLCSRTPIAHSLFKLDLIMVRALSWIFLEKYSP